MLSEKDMTESILSEKMLHIRKISSLIRRMFRILQNKQYIVKRIDKTHYILYNYNANETDGQVRSERKQDGKGGEENEDYQKKRNGRHF